MVGLEARNPFCKSGQTVPAALHGGVTQMALCIQAIALAHCFFEVFHTPQVPRLQLTDFKTKTVGSQINGGEEGLGLHGGVGGSSGPDYVTDI